MFLNKKVRILTIFAMKFVPNGLIYNKPEFVQIMAWRRSGDKALSESMMAYFTDAFVRPSAAMC